MPNATSQSSPSHLRFGTRPLIFTPTTVLVDPSARPSTSRRQSSSMPSSPRRASSRTSAARLRWRARKATAGLNCAVDSAGLGCALSYWEGRWQMRGGMHLARVSRAGTRPTGGQTRAKAATTRTGWARIVNGAREIRGYAREGQTGQWAEVVDTSVGEQEEKQKAGRPDGAGPAARTGRCPSRPSRGGRRRTSLGRPRLRRRPQHHLHLCSPTPGRPPHRRRPSRHPQR